ncbi:DUF7681 family protein [Falsiroseomonas sp. CW058]|uniref:Acb2/Tad1 domain-containing protein n=1 Tax=Falsiroseomonas sp. CW058 TaxID=3388664 RepID=UPI003D321A89
MTEESGNAAHIYADGADARLASETIKPSRFRPRYRRAGPDELALHDEIKGKAAELEALFLSIPRARSASGLGVSASMREEAIAMTKLEEAVMWAIKGLFA